MISSNQQFAVVILNHNKRDDLLESIQSVLDSSIKPVQIVVVDNASSDDSVSAVRAAFPDIALIANDSNLGVSGGRNVGWRFAQSHFTFEYVLFLDDDASLSQDYLSEIGKTFETNPKAGIVCGKAFTTHSRQFLMSVGIKANLFTGTVEDIGVGECDHGQYDQSCERGASGGFAFCSRASLFDELGAFDESYNPYGWEDVDFCLKAKHAGYITQYQPAAVLVHKGSKAGRRPKASYEVHKIRNYLLLLRRHTSPLQKLSCLVFVPLRCAKVAYKMLRSGNARVISAQARGFISGLVLKR